MKEFAEWFKELDRDVEDARSRLGASAWDLADEELRHWIAYWRSLPAVTTTTYISTQGLTTDKPVAAAIGDRYLCRDCKEHRLVW